MLLELPCLDQMEEGYFPDTDCALPYPNGLLAWGGTLSSRRLVSAYRSGIFPWYSKGEPILWWSPSPRCVLETEEVYISSRTRRRLRQGAFQFTSDVAFEAVIEGCAMPDTGRESTWISDDMKVAYIQMYHDGIAHSVETWMEGQLVGGIYGLSIGKMFFGESMFSLVPDASKTALIMLCRQLNDWGFELIDCQVGNPHLLRMGAKEIERVEFEARLKIAVEQHHPDDFWKQGINTGRDW